jgi:hypothetical protein
MALKSPFYNTSDVITVSNTTNNRVVLVPRLHNPIITRQLMEHGVPEVVQVILVEVELVATKHNNNSTKHHRSIKARILKRQKEFWKY